MAQIIDGKKIAAEILTAAQKRVMALVKRGHQPGLATVLVGEDPASQVYVGQKIKKCESVGIKSIHRPLPATINAAILGQTIKELNLDDSVDGILVQLPLPKNIDPEPIINLIDPSKDADGLHPLNQGLLGRLKSWDDIQRSGIPIPCTPAGVIELLLRTGVSIEGKHAVVVGRSTLVGKPVYQLLLSLNATVTMAHSKTVNLSTVCRSADILVAAMGRQEFIRKDAVQKGAIVIDVGINRTELGIKGDVQFDSVKDVASWITPVPGGVGPMTVAMLIQNTIRLAENRLK